MQENLVNSFQDTAGTSYVIIDICHNPTKAPRKHCPHAKTAYEIKAPLLS